MSNTVEYQKTVCPFRWIGDDLQVFYKQAWLTVKEADVKAI